MRVSVYCKWHNLQQKGKRTEMQRNGEKQDLPLGGGVGGGVLFISLKKKKVHQHFSNLPDDSDSSVNVCFTSPMTCLEL